MKIGDTVTGNILGIKRTGKVLDISLTMAEVSWHWEAPNYNSYVSWYSFEELQSGSKS